MVRFRWIRQSAYEEPISGTEREESAAGRLVRRCMALHDDGVQGAAGRTRETPNSGTRETSLPEKIHRRALGKPLKETFTTFLMRRAYRLS